MIRDKYMAIKNWQTHPPKFILLTVLFLWVVLVIVCGWTYSTEKQKRRWIETRTRVWYEELRKLSKNKMRGGFVSKFAPQNFAFAPKGVLNFTPPIAPDLYSEVQNCRAIVAPWRVAIDWNGAKKILQPDKLYWLKLSPADNQIGEPTVIKSGDELLNFINSARDERTIGIVLGKIDPNFLHHPELQQNAIARFPQGEIRIKKQRNVFGIFIFSQPSLPLFLASEDPIVISFSP